MSEQVDELSIVPSREWVARDQLTCHREWIDTHAHVAQAHALPLLMLYNWYRRCFHALYTPSIGPLLVRKGQKGLVLRP